MPNNIFDLSQMVTKNNDVEVKTNVITTQERNDMLIGYREILKQNWENIPVGSHIRYQNKDGSFRKGGYVKAVWKEGTNKIKIDLVSGYNYNAFAWSINLTKIDKIWQKDIQQQAPRVNSDELNDLREEIQQMKKEINLLKIEIKKTYNELQRTIISVKNIALKLKR
jgi:hypothetical protein